MPVCPEDSGDPMSLVSLVNKVGLNKESAKISGSNDVTIHGISCLEQRKLSLFKPDRKSVV